MTAFSRDFACTGCGRAYVVSGDSPLRPASETEVLAQFRCSCGQWMGAFVPGSADPDRLVLALKGERQAVAGEPARAAGRSASSRA
jgi:hypothetical protein